jgi:hypothetical protein
VASPIQAADYPLVIIRLNMLIGPLGRTQVGDVPNHRQVVDVGAKHPGADFADRVLPPSGSLPRPVDPAPAQRGHLAAIIKTATTIITSLMAALLQNSQTRSDQAVQHKLNALADGLAEVMDHPASGSGERDLRRDMKELRAAVGA